MGRAKVTNRLETLEDWAAGLLGQLEPASRNKLARSIGQALRRSQQQRIIAQRNPGGSKYAPRKQRNLRGKKGRGKRKIQMFKKLRTARFLKAQSDSDIISIGFTGRIAKIAKVHQYGLRDRVGQKASNIEYEQRIILGFTEENFILIRTAILKHFSP